MRKIDVRRAFGQMATCREAVDVIVKGLINVRSLPGCRESLNIGCDTVDVRGRQLPSKGGHGAAAFPVRNGIHDSLLRNAGAGSKVREIRSCSRSFAIVAVA